MIALMLLLAIPVQVPANWTCDDASYGDGVVCDCGCDAPDTDCDTSEHSSCDTSGCPAGQAPWEHQNDQCMASTCGDGWKADDEVCDDFDRRASGGCNADCSAVNVGFICGEAAVGCEAVDVGEGEGEGEGEEDDSGGCAGSPAGLGVALVSLLAGRRRRR